MFKNLRIHTFFINLALLLNLSALQAAQAPEQTPTQPATPEKTQPWGALGTPYQTQGFPEVQTEPFSYSSDGKSCLEGYLTYILRIANAGKFEQAFKLTNYEIDIFDSFGYQLYNKTDK